MAEKNHSHTDAPETQRDDVKGKQKADNADTSLSDRIQQSASMALNALASGPSLDPTRNGFSDSKGSHIAASSEHERLQPTLADAPSHRIHQSAHLDTARFRPEPSSSSDADFSSFRNGPEWLEWNNAHLPAQRDQLGSAFAQQEAVDGAAVLDLLNEDPGESGLLGIYLPSGDELFITPDEHERLTQALFGGEEGARLETLLEPGDDDKDANIWGDEQWREVFASYTDDVWGDLGPLALAAKKETQDHTQKPKDRTALAQLTSALRQLRAKL